MPAEFVRRSVKVAGVRLAYVERRPAPSCSRPPLLLLHGLIATAEAIAIPLADLPDDRRIVALDILTAEAGNSEAALDLSFSSLASLTVEFAAQVGLDRPIVLGHSHGGALALQVAVMYPEVPRGLVLLSPAHPFGGYSDALVQFYTTAVGRAFARLLPLIPARWFNVSRLAGPNSVISKAQVARYRAALCLPSTVPRTMSLLRSWRDDMDSLGRALQNAPVAVPTLLLWGDRDPAVPVASATALERYLTASERVTLQGVGHLPADEAPVVCVAAITQWLARVERESSGKRGGYSLSG